MGEFHGVQRQLAPDIEKGAKGMYSTSESREIPSAKNLMEILDANEDVVNEGHPENAERLRRAIGFIGRAEAINFEDIRFVCYWMALNALYGDGDSAHKTTIAKRETAMMNKFIMKVFACDKNDEIFKIIDGVLAEKIKEMFHLKQASRAFWISGYNHKIWRESEDGDISRHLNAMSRNLDAEKRNEKLKKSIEQFDEIWEGSRPIAKKSKTWMIKFLFERIYPARNQLVHGCISVVNDEMKMTPLRIGLDILRWLVPVFIKIVLETTDKIDLGPIPYPSLGDGPFPPPHRPDQVTGQGGSLVDESKGQSLGLFEKSAGKKD